MYSRHASKEINIDPLFKPLSLSFAQRQAQNRFLKAVMSKRLASWDPERLDPRGIPSKELIACIDAGRVRDRANLNWKHYDSL